MALVVLVAYGLWLIAALASGAGPRDRIYLGRHFLGQSNASQVIKLDPSYPNVSEIGYDGQFFYYLALDPVNARYYMDVSTYRYTRIFYPMLARVLAFGQPSLIPWTLLLINWLAIAGGTLALAAWLRRRALSPWYAAIYGFYPGLFVALERDLSEALGYGLVATAVYLFDFGSGRRRLLAALVFALAALTRETTAVFAVLYAGAVLLESPHPALPQRGREMTQRVESPHPVLPQRGRAMIGDRVRANWRSAGLFLLIALLPLAAYKLFLLRWLGAGHDIGIPLAHIPFQGLWFWRYWEVPGRTEEVRSVVFPGLIAGAVAAYALWKRVVRVEIVLVLVNVVLFIVFLQADAYVEIQASSRVTMGVMLAAILSLTWIVARTGRRAWFWVCSALWLSIMPFWLVIPAARYFLHFLRVLRA